MFNWSKKDPATGSQNWIYCMYCLMYYCLWIGGPGSWHGYQIGRNLMLAFGGRSIVECLGLGVWAWSQSAHEPWPREDQKGWDLGWVSAAEQQPRVTAWSSQAWSCWKGAQIRTSFNILIQKGKEKEDILGTWKT